MKRSLFALTIVLSLLFAFSCARDEQREARYNPKQCPFCTTNPGVCFYCGGSGKCSFCNGTGKRKTVSPDVPEQDLKKAFYTETCPYCKGTGKCRYCDGKGKCWACKGTGAIESWEFYEQFRKNAQAPPPAASKPPDSLKTEAGKAGTK
jgi:DnaJ-class molecular chaperone